MIERTDMPFFTQGKQFSVRSTTKQPIMQTVLITERINNLTNYLKSNKQDNHSRRGLMQLVGRRRGLLEYLKKTDLEGYRTLIEKLNIRK